MIVYEADVSVDQRDHTDAMKDATAVKNLEWMRHPSVSNCNVGNVNEGHVDFVTHYVENDESTCKDGYLHGGSKSDLFGSTVSFSANGAMLAVGSPGYTYSDKEKTYTYQRVGKMEVFHVMNNYFGKDNHARDPDSDVTNRKTTAAIGKDERDALKIEDQGYVDRAIELKRDAYQFSSTNNYNFYRVWHTRHTGSEFSNRATHIGAQGVVSKDGGTIADANGREVTMLKRLATSGDERTPDEVESDFVRRIVQKQQMSRSFKFSPDEPGLRYAFSDLPSQLVTAAASA